MRENRPSGSEGGGAPIPLSLPLASNSTLQEQSKILRSAQDDMWERSDLPNVFRRSAPKNRSSVLQIG